MGLAGLDADLDYRCRRSRRFCSRGAGQPIERGGDNAKRMKIERLLIVVAGLGCIAADWELAKPGWRYEFPRDHHAHESFKTEWWYFTGNLTDQRNRRFGYELTFFRQGIRPPNDRTGTSSRFIVDDLKFAHFTVTDTQSKNFIFHEKANRGSFGEAGFDRDEQIAWIDSWNLRMNRNSSFELTADAENAKLKLHLVPVKPPVIHGLNGVSQKAAGEGHASHYYSITRLQTTGQLVVRGSTFSVSGESWFDHEWATNQLAPGQAGWNWVSTQFGDKTELMLYQMRLTNGGVDPVSSGTFIEADGSAISLTNADFQMAPLEFWKSPSTGANYPIGWRIVVPKTHLDFVIQPVLSNQELVFSPLIYWEGAFDAIGSREGKSIGGRGYLELTGYAGKLKGLNP
jgi:predicted secreted hydrolase